ncbi:anti-sigma factor domain-containing protein [Streptomyces sp. NPDC016845]|uniref:anti-sigma factor n=1 Tax=Streptomyces sp. NPDC016845 TaxID=3364972 RepID=UPI0037B21BE0
MSPLPRWPRDRHALAAPYALDALGPRELASFERHMASCGRCAAEARSYAADAVRLARATAAPVPAGLRDRVLAALRDVEQEPGPAPPVSPPRARRPLLVPLAAGAAALALLAAALLGLELTRTQDRLDEKRNEAREMAHVLAAPDARAARTDGLAVVASPARREAVITVTDLAAPPRGQDHQLWLMSGSEPPRSLAVLPDRGPDTPLLASGLTASASSLAVTEEPDGGSERPSSAPLVQLALNSVGFGE